MYKTIPVFDKSLLNFCEEYIHRACQFPAMVGKNYLEDEPDDSNANLGFDAEESKIKGRDAGGFSLDVDVTDWKLVCNRNGSVQSFVNLVNKDKNAVFEWVRDNLIDAGFDGTKLKFIDHYEIPDHPIEHGKVFPELDSTLINTWLIMRSNANVMLKELNGIVGIDSEIRIWPHHFDTGTYYAWDEKRAIGAGWAMADSLCDNPYLYIYGWNGEASVDYSSAPELKIGKWIVTDNWQGAVVESEELSLNEEQYEQATKFMKSVTAFLKPQLTNK
ncbi:MAG: hypothetical protein RIM99_07965 [Cyclobacteriaceae bacterium]